MGDESVKFIVEVEDSECELAADTSNMDENKPDEEKVNKSAARSMDVFVSAEKEGTKHGDELAKESIDESVLGENVEKPEESFKTERKEIEQSVDEKKIDEEKGNESAVQSMEVAASVENKEDKQSDESAEENVSVSEENVEKAEEPDKIEGKVVVSVSDGNVVGNLELAVDHVKLAGAEPVRNQETDEGTEEKKEEEKGESQKTSGKVVDYLTVESKEVIVALGNEDVCKDTEEKEIIKDETDTEHCSQELWFSSWFLVISCRICVCKRKKKQ